MNKNPFKGKRVPGGNERFQGRKGDEGNFRRRSEGSNFNPRRSFSASSSDEDSEGRNKDSHPYKSRSTGGYANRTERGSYSSRRPSYPRRDDQGEGTSERRFNSNSDSSGFSGRKSFGSSNRFDNKRPSRSFSDRRDDFRKREGDSDFRPRRSDQSEERPYSSQGSERKRFDKPRESFPRRSRDEQGGRGSFSNDRPTRNRFDDRRSDRSESNSTENYRGGDRTKSFGRSNRSDEQSSGGGFIRRRNAGSRDSGFSKDRGDRGFHKAEGDNSFRKTYDKPAGERSFHKRHEETGGERTFRKRTDDSYPPKTERSAAPKPKPSQPKDDGTTRLNKYLANAGICSRREADDLIKAGLVKVNDEVVTEMGVKVTDGDVVKFNDATVKTEKKIYLLLNKPKDYITTTDDPHAKKNVMELVQDACKERIYPVGRLDRNTTGVLLFTNDGDLAGKLTHPSQKKKKIYQVHLDKALTKNDMQQIADGIELDDGFMQVDAITFVDPEDKKLIGIEIHSGKNRIVRRIFESLDYKIMSLDRVYFAGLTKKNVPRGKWRMLTEKEVSFLQMGNYK